MAVRDLMPWGRTRSPLPSERAGGGELTPFFALHREVNRLFDDVFKGFDGSIPSVFGRGASWPSLEVTANDNEVRVSAELPGLEEKDVEVTVDGDVLTIRGEKRSETEDKDKHFSERYYGRFERSLSLPFEVDESRAQAGFRNGVLSITLPKSAKAEERAKRIPIGGAGASGSSAAKS
ncbi:Hsp20/alpha crystallin family protein [Enterovirga aerilata]|uniref:Hsp20/alpha crystallin family protein n=1 Tax=Enterovirga aerilata TaxID=2730920 RepID=A0A849I630_9HYPH|nr:Hsp20/alpha crystallin family protein [Enterovirga sp. DB1703]NNM71497.1 Hsp20/alpha crystallin family protein [Enterovirga sp. DB1703]